MSAGPVAPMLVALTAILLGIFASRFVVAWILRREPFDPYVPQLMDLPWFLAGALVMFISGVLATEGDGSVWSYVIDTGSFLVGTSLFAIAEPRSWPRYVGLLVVGIHAAQVLLTNSNAPGYFLVQALSGGA